ncbi:ribonuclease HII [Aminirod propionatiphilus]|uniref:Ribonuclease HII n=1 Tax=Aminirod propionatiphilus TaxID=3415223 RepID=A0ACD1DTR1_9BACT|nr:ribonuclease HII [Synergistota bacterium]
MAGRLIVGTDEAGRGPLAGPVVAAAVVLTRPQREILLDLGLRDSKKLSEARRESLFLSMSRLGVLWRAQAASPARIERMNILQASLWAMKRSVLALAVEADRVIVDGNRLIPGLPFDQRALPGADDIVPAVAAASVVAKVLRDRAMTALDRLYPQWGFARHKGYGTASHREALRCLGLCPIHRPSFCRKILP